MTPFTRLLVFCVTTFCPTADFNDGRESFCRFLFAIDQDSSSSYLVLQFAYLGELYKIMIATPPTLMGVWECVWNILL